MYLCTIHALDVGSGNDLTGVPGSVICPVPHHHRLWLPNNLEPYYPLTIPYHPQRAYVPAVG